MKAIELLKVVVPGLQRLGSAVMNITGVISVMNHTHLEVTKDNHSMPKHTYLGPWQTVLWLNARLKTLRWALNRISAIFLDLPVYSKRTQNDLLPQSNFF